MSDNLDFFLSIESLSDTDKIIRRQDTQAVDKFNNDIKAWTQKIQARTRAKAKSLFQNGKNFDKSIKGKTYALKERGSNVREINRISFQFDRHGIYLHYGASRSYGGYTGSRWYNSKGKLKETLTTSLGRMGTGNRPEADWFDSVVNENIKDLTEILSDYSLSMAVDATQILIDK